MATTTQRTVLTKALEARGYVRDTTTKTQKYHVFAPTPGAKILLKPSDCDASHRIFLGVGGAVRFSSTGRSTASIPFSEGTKNRLLDEGRNI